MKADDFGFWDIDPFEGCDIECPDCKEWSPMDTWKECELYCEDCGTHDAIVCPECDTPFDHVWSPRFKTK